MMKRLISYFLQGLLFTVPLAATIYVIYQLFLFIDGIIPLEIPGLGMVLIVAIITFVGYLGTFYFASHLFLIFDRMLERAPLAKLIYTSVKDFIAAFVGEKKRFTQPVLVTVKSDPLVQQIGFITQNDLTHLGLSVETMAVYVPFAYSFMGELIIVPVSSIKFLEASGTEMMKFVISGGVTEIS
jgi:uncharacterized membrane protein